MRIYLIVALAIAIFTIHEARACEGLHGIVGLGKNNSSLTSSHEWEASSNLGCIIGAGYRQQLTDSLYQNVSLRHYSQCFVGEPWNDDDEMSSNHLYYTLEW